MSRPRREFTAESFALEGRLLQATVPQAQVPPTVGFEGTTIPGTTKLSQSDATIPPKIVSVQGAPQAIVLTFSKPMDPDGASNVNNYLVRATRTSMKRNPFLGLIDNPTQLLHWGRSISISYSTSTHTVPLQAAEYDPATNSVTLVPKRKLTYSADIIVTQGHQLKASGRPGHQSNPGPGLTDLEGNPINGDTTPGKFGVSVRRGTRSLSGNSATVNGVE
jgi:hypothetical protein